MAHTDTTRLESVAIFEPSYHVAASYLVHLSLFAAEIPKYL